MPEPEPEPEIYASMVAAATASESAVAQAVASFAPTPAHDPPTSAVAFDPTHDPDDAFAPVLEDAHTVPATAWHEPTADGQHAEDSYATPDPTGEAWVEAWQSAPVASEQTQLSSYAPVEPSDLACSPKRRPSGPPRRWKSLQHPSKPLLSSC
jgi:hypothetical protein